MTGKQLQILSFSPLSLLSPAGSLPSLVSLSTPLCCACAVDQRRMGTATWQQLPMHASRSREGGEAAAMAGRRGHGMGEEGRGTVSAERQRGRRRRRLVAPKPTDPSFICLLGRPRPPGRRRRRLPENIESSLPSLAPFLSCLAI